MTRIALIGPYPLLRHRSLEIYQGLLLKALKAHTNFEVHDWTPSSPVFERWVPRCLQRFNVVERALLLPALHHRRTPVDIVHATSADAGFLLPASRAKARVCTFHDFGDFDFVPDEGPWRRRARRYRQHNNRVAMANIDVACTISAFTRDRLRALFGAPEIPAHVIHNPCRFADPGAFPPPTAAEEALARAQQPYLFHVGNIPRKNRPRLLEAFARLRHGPLAGRGLRLVLLGALYPHEVEALRKLGIGDAVTVVDDVSDGLLQAYYEKAEAFVFPSLYEGFGFPVIEAQCFDTPVVAAELPVLREIGGEGCLHAVPEDVEHLAAQLLRVLTDDDLRRNLVERGRANTARFTTRTWVNGYSAAYADALDRARARHTKA